MRHYYKLLEIWCDKIIKVWDLQQLTDFLSLLLLKYWFWTFSSVLHIGILEFTATKL